MEDQEKTTKSPRYSKKASSRGGRREGAGRPKNSRDQLTVRGLLEALDRKTNGRDYEDILVEDFLQSRLNNDTQLTLKYHNLILNKVMSSLAKIEVNDSSEAIEAKQAAFAAALAKLVGVDPETK
jgi:hypothetical protein